MVYQAEKYWSYFGEELPVQRTRAAQALMSNAGPAASSASGRELGKELMVRYAQALTQQFQHVLQLQLPAGIDTTSDTDQEATAVASTIRGGSGAEEGANVEARRGARDGACTLQDIRAGRCTRGANSIGAATISTDPHSAALKSDTTKATERTERVEAEFSRSSLFTAETRRGPDVKVELSPTSEEAEEALLALLLGEAQGTVRLSIRTADLLLAITNLHSDVTPANQQQQGGEAAASALGAGGPGGDHQDGPATNRTLSAGELGVVESEGKSKKKDEKEKDDELVSLLDDDQLRFRLGVGLAKLGLFELSMKQVWRAADSASASSLWGSLQPHSRSPLYRVRALMIFPPVHTSVRALAAAGEVCTHSCGHECMPTRMPVCIYAYIHCSTLFTQHI